MKVENEKISAIIKASVGSNHVKQLKGKNVQTIAAQYRYTMIRIF